MTTCEEATIGLAVGWPCTEMPNSVSVPITRRTLMRRAYAGGRWQDGAHVGDRRARGPVRCGRRVRESRSVVRRDNLLHAATAVLVRDPAGRIYVHRRSPDKDWAPSHHDAAAGGVMAYGEEPAASAARELAEELGVTGATLRPLGLSVYEDDATRCVEHCFETTWDGAGQRTPTARWSGAPG